MSAIAPLKQWAEAAAARVAEYQVSAVYVCPVPGADETASIIAGPGKAPVKAFPGFDQSGSPERESSGVGPSGRHR